MSANSVVERSIPNWYTKVSVFVLCLEWGDRMLLDGEDGVSNAGSFVSVINQPKGGTFIRVEC